MATWSNLKTLHKIAALGAVLAALGMLAGALYILITQVKKEKHERNTSLIILGLTLSALSASMLLGTALVLVLLSND